MFPSARRPSRHTARGKRSKEKNGRPFTRFRFSPSVSALFRIVVSPGRRLFASFSLGHPLSILQGSRKVAHKHAYRQTRTDAHTRIHRLRQTQRYKQIYTHMESKMRRKVEIFSTQYLCCFVCFLFVFCACSSKKAEKSVPPAGPPSVPEGQASPPSARSPEQVPKRTHRVQRGEERCRRLLLPWLHRCSLWRDGIYAQKNLSCFYFIFLICQKEHVQSDLGSWETILVLNCIFASSRCV